MPTRRGQSFSGAPKSVKPEKQFLLEKSLIDFDLKNGDRFRNENRSPIFPE
jgi:hypothetical protein